MIRILLRCMLGFFILFLAHAAISPTFTLTSSAFKDQGTIPALYTCDGKNISPPLTWTNAPPNTVSFALALTSPDWSAGSVYLWVLYNIPKDIHSLVEGANKELPDGIQVSMNYYNENAYNGPCPPDNNNHHYVFTIYALDKMLDLPYDAETDTIISHVDRHTLQQAHLTGNFSH